MMNFFLESITFDYVYECLNHDFKAVSSDSFAAVVLRAKCKNVANKMQKIGFKKRHFKRLLNAK